MALGAAQSARRHHRDADRRALPARATSRPAAWCITAACATSRRARCSPRCGARSQWRAPDRDALRPPARPLPEAGSPEPEPPWPIRARMPYALTSAARSEVRRARRRRTATLSPRLSRSPTASPRSLKSGGKVLLAGNGGSAADAQHIAAEFVGRFVNDRAPLPAIALTTDTSALTAIGNDYGFEQVFARQVRALGRKGDVFIGDLDLRPLAQHPRGAARPRASSASSTVGFTRAATTPMHPLCDLRPRRAVGRNRADPAAPHHRRARDLPPGRARAVRRAAEGLTMPPAASRETSPPYSSTATASSITTTAMSARASASASCRAPRPRSAG